MRPPRAVTLVITLASFGCAHATVQVPPRAQAEAPPTQSALVPPVRVADGARVPPARLPEAQSIAAPRVPIVPIPALLSRGMSPLAARAIVLLPASINAAPSAASLRDGEPNAMLHAQILLDRLNYSVGVLDAAAGKNTEHAVTWFQREQGLPATGTIDSATFARLALLAGTPDVLTRVAIGEDVTRGHYVRIPESVYQQAKLSCMCYNSALEMLAERYHTVPEVLVQLNPGVEFRAPTTGSTIWAPNVSAGRRQISKTVAQIRVSKGGQYVHALAADGSLIYHFPTTLGSRYDPSPKGLLAVKSVDYEPSYQYDPTLFSDAPHSKPGAELPPGPNSPVGLVWIALSRPHVGIHGTPNPETVGWASSHGCVRLTNWDVRRLAAILPVGTPVEFGY